MIRSMIALMALCVTTTLGAQSEHEGAEAAFQAHHSIGLVLSHAHIFEGVNEAGDKETLSLPAWGVDYNYFFHHKWAIGLQADLIIEEFLVEKHLGTETEEAIERSYPFAPAVMATYKPWEHLAFKFGAGAEFASTENFFLTRAGVECGTHFGHREWEVFGTLSYDFKWNAYDTWLLGIGIGKSFWG